MRLLLTTKSTNGEYDGGIVAAFVEITPALAKLILARHELHKEIMQKDSRLHDMYFWDISAKWLGTLPQELVDAEVDLIKTARIYYQDVNTEIEQMAISERGVWWTCSPKHADLYVSTERIDFDRVRRAL